ncbi:hypothetical protein [Paraburkholderia sp. PGU19]|nr:hypothetical protein [Paraburkholderia sp. PGU19]
MIDRLLFDVGQIDDGAGLLGHVPYRRAVTSVTVGGQFRHSTD